MLSWIKTFKKDNKFYTDTDANISYSLPKNFENLKYLSFLEKTLPENIANKIENFYAENNVLFSGNTLLIKYLDIKKFLNIYGDLIVLWDEKEIYGSILSTIIPISVKTNLIIEDKWEKLHEKFVEKGNIILATTTFLTIHKKYRRKGLGLALILKSLNTAHKKSISGAYFLNTVKRSPNAVPLKLWQFPIDLLFYDRMGFSYPKKYSRFYNFVIPDWKRNIWQVDNSNYEKAFNIYKSLTKDKTFVFSPNLYYWKKWTENFPVYVYTENDIVGMFGLLKVEGILSHKNMHMFYGHLLFCIGNQTLKICILQCREIGIQTLNIYQCGDITHKILNDMMALETNHTDYLNFYNCNIEINPEDIYIPLI